MSDSANCNPLASTNLNDNEAWPFLEGADEVVIRVSRYEKDGETPAAYQCIVRGRNRTRPWGLGVRRGAVGALTTAIESFFRPHPDSKTNVEIASDEHEIRMARPARKLPIDQDIDDLLG